MLQPVPSRAIVQQIEDEFTAKHNVTLHIKREDLIHPAISGNKWRKLKYNLLAANEGGFKKVLTFGGAFSNHIYATAAAAKLAGLGSIGIIRGELTAPLNPTLQFAKNEGMQLHAVAREDYRLKAEADFFENLKARFGDFYLIPEGGTNREAVKGTAEILDGLENYDLITCAVGTGGTLAGIISAATANTEVLGISALKGDDSLTAAVEDLLKQADRDGVQKNWRISFDHHHGGYAKVTKELVQFMNWFFEKHQILLDQVYTAKMMFAIYQMMEGQKLEGKRVLAIHTGGLQSVWGMEKKLRKLGLSDAYFQTLAQRL